jgi:diguanylate cyclase (GGDEF)-like protein/PAS domain S-box-containing protein
MRPAFLTWGGEFADPAQEADFQAERLAESVWHARLALGLALFANLLFYLSDWRYFGQPHFATAMAARTVIVVASLTAMLAAGRITDFRQLARLCAVWTVFTIVASSVLVSPRTDIGLLFIFVLPIIFYLVLPMPFGWVLGAGLGGGILPLATFIVPPPPHDTWPGLVLGLLTLNMVLAVALIRSNRLQRLAWAVTQAERLANDHLTRHRETLRALLQAVPAPMIIADRKDGRILQANEAARGYFGERLLRQTRAVQASIEGRDLRKLVKALEAGGRVDGFETRLRLADGVVRAVLLSATTAEVDSVEAVLVALTDITERKEMEAHLKRLASTDPLTGLVNRARFFALADDEIRRAQRYGRPLAVIMADIDHFKRFNDTYGHRAGDRALEGFAGLCRTLVRAQDTVARLGGEEFGLLLPETDADQALGLAHRLRTAVAGMHLGNLPAPITISIGISQLFAGETTVDAALSRADQALYAAKRSGRNRVIHFDAAA